MVIEDAVVGVVASEECVGSGADSGWVGEWIW